MSTGPFYNLIGSTTSAAAGTGAFTPSAAAPGFISWTDSILGVAAGWVGLVRYEDGADWELRYDYWNGTALSRPANGLVASSTGSALSLSSAAVALMVPDGALVQPNLGTGMGRGWTGIGNSSGAPSAVGTGALTVTGTAGNAALATTNLRTEIPQSQVASATTANAQAGFAPAAPLAVNNTAAGRGGWLFMCRFGTSTTIPALRRLFVGATGTNYVGQTIDPSAFTAHFAAFALDAADTNIQLLTNSNAGGGTKIDTTIPLVQDGWYHAQIWMRPGGGRVYALLVRLDTGAIWYGTTTTDIPGTTTLLPNCVGGLSSTTGTAFTLNMGALMLRAGAC